MLKFSNAEVDAKYQSSFVGDPVIHLPGKKATGFKNNLSKLTLEQADKLFAVANQNLLQLKDAAPKPAAAKEAEEKPIEKQ